MGLREGFGNWKCLKKQKQKKINVRNKIYKEKWRLEVEEQHMS